MQRYSSERWPTITEVSITPNIIGTNLLTKFHEDRKINVASRVLKRFYYSHIKKNTPPPGGHVFQPKGIIFRLVQNIIGMNLLTKFHEDWTINVASRVHVFQANIIIFELIQDNIETNLLTTFHEDWTINVASREKCPAPGGHVLKATKTIFYLIQDIIGANLLTLFHDNRKINVTSRVLTRNKTIAKQYMSPTSSTIVTIFKLIQDIIRTNLLTKFHEDRKINMASRVLTRKKCPAHWWPYIIGMNLPTKFHENWTINVASEKNAPPLGSHVFQANVTIFELIQDIIETNLLTKFHEDWTINVASRELTRQMLMAHDGRRTLCLGELKNAIV
ncbi:hypothetical protein DPMN_063145 [Dreissena polymorpha]|uniref:Uncharacterized protein n=1 Tax=Dreissena polymorpha TaxID=45954 RepID=A0A9D4C9Y7_DREPO|nr:hypothetical protein DPMN_063145 [Dreissena polymorpha]